MIVNSEFHTFILIAAGFTLFFVKIGASDDPEKRFFIKMFLRLLSIALFLLGIGFLNQFDFVISLQTIVFWGFLIEAIIAFILAINLSIPNENENENENE